MLGRAIPTQGQCGLAVWPSRVPFSSGTRAPLSAAGENLPRPDPKVRILCRVTACRRRLSALDALEEALTYKCPTCYTSIDYIAGAARGALLHSLGRRWEAIELCVLQLDASKVSWTMPYGVQGVVSTYSACLSPGLCVERPPDGVLCKLLWEWTSILSMPCNMPRDFNYSVIHGKARGGILGRMPVVPPHASRG
jgi:hypothetical protein